MARINIDQLSLTVLRDLEVYRANTIESVKEAVTETAKETVKELKRTSPKGATKDYSKSWAYKRDRSLRGKWRYSMVVYSKKPDYRLTHLLENGHAKVNGGRVPGQPHIKIAEQHAIRLLDEKLRRKLTEDV